MSDHIPFEIQSEIIKRLPVKSLVQFRSVSKQWKSFIDSPEFINNYHINHTNPQHHLLVRYTSENVITFTSIVDDNTFPQQKFSLTTPESLSLLGNTTLTLDSVNGLLYFSGRYGGLDSSTRMVVIWNPAVRKSVGIVIPIPKAVHIVVGFGVCPDTSDIKLVKICVDKISRMWEVEFFTLSTRVWKTVYKGAPFKSCYRPWFQVFVNGVIYFLADDEFYLVDGVGYNFVISFDLKNEKCGEVCLPDRLVYAPYLNAAKVNKTLVLLDHYNEDEMLVCGVWTRKDSFNKPFTKIYTVMLDCVSRYNMVLGFRNNGEVVMEVSDFDWNNYHKSRIEVYKPLSGNTNGVGIIGNQSTFSVWSYMETLLLLDQSDSIIHYQR